MQGSPELAPGFKLSSRFVSAPRLRLLPQPTELGSTSGTRLKRKRLQPLAKEVQEPTPLSPIRQSLGKVLSSLKSTVVQALLFQHFKNIQNIDLEVHKQYSDRARLVYKALVLHEHCLLGIVECGSKPRWNPVLKLLLALFLAVDSGEGAQSLVVRFEQALAQARDCLRSSRQIWDHLTKCLQERFSMTPVRRHVHSLLQHYALVLTTRWSVGLCRPDKASFMSSPEPCLPPCKREPTLVLDLDETLIHFDASKGLVHIRPFANQFLEEMHKHFELVVFTAAMPDYANWILNLLDQRKRVEHRLFRHHAVITAEGIVKDLSRLGRRLDKMVMIDNLKENFRLQADNGIEIVTWVGDPADNQLQKLMYQLPKLLAYGDVRAGLTQLRLSKRQQ